MKNNQNKLNIKDFVLKYKLSFILVLLFTIFIYGIKLYHYSISIDTEAIINSFNAQIMAWNSINRFSLMFLKYIFHLNPFNYYISNSVMIFFFFLSTYCLYYIIYKYSNHKPSNLKIALFNMLIISSPIFAEQFNFTLQCAEVAISLFIFDIGLILFFKYISSHNILFIVFSILCFTVCLGCYQSFMTLLISILIFYLLINYKFDKKIKDYLFYFVSSLIVIIATFILYTIISKTVMNIYNIASSNYLKDQITWFSVPVFYNLKRLIIYGGEVILGYGPFYSLSYLLCFIIIIINIIKHKHNLFYIFINILCLLSPFTLSILLGTPEAIRAQIGLPIIVSLVITFMNNIHYKNIMITIVIIIITSQTYNTLTLLHDDYIRYTYDFHLAQDIIKKIDYGIDNKKIIFIGHIKDYSKLKKGEVLGRSFFNWDIDSPLGINGRAIGFMNTLGYDLENPTLEEYNLAKELSLKKHLTIYPDRKSIYKYKNLIIINLSK